MATSPRSPIEMKWNSGRIRRCFSPTTTTDLLKEIPKIKSGIINRNKKRTVAVSRSRDSQSNKPVLVPGVYETRMIQEIKKSVSISILCIINGIGKQEETKKLYFDANDYIYTFINHIASFNNNQPISIWHLRGRNHITLEHNDCLTISDIGLRDGDVVHVTFTVSQ